MYTCTYVHIYTVTCMLVCLLRIIFLIIIKFILNIYCYENTTTNKQREYRHDWTNFQTMNFLNWFFYLSIYPFIHLSILPLTDLSIQLSIHPSIHPSINWSLYPAIHSSIHLSILPLTDLSIRLSIRASIYQSKFNTIKNIIGCYGFLHFLIIMFTQLC